MLVRRRHPPVTMSPSVRNPVKPQTDPNQRFIVTAWKPSETNPARSIRYTRVLGRKLTRTQETRTMYRVTYSNLNHRRASGVDAVISSC
jgi:hypothetical protein